MLASFQPIDDYPVEENRVVDKTEQGLRISLSAKSGKGYEAALLNVSGTPEDVAKLLKIDLDEDGTVAVGTLLVQWNKMHGWWMEEYTKATGKA